MLYANEQDVAAAYEGDITEALSARVDYLIRAVSARLTATIPALSGWVAGGQVDPDIAADVVVKAVLRQLRNPDGSVTRSQSLGEYSTSASYDKGTAASGMFDAADLTLLHPPSARSGPIRMRPWPLMRP